MDRARSCEIVRYRAILCGIVRYRALPNARRTPRHTHISHCGLCRGNTPKFGALEIPKRKSAGTFEADFLGDFRNQGRLSGGG